MSGSDASGPARFQVKAERVYDRPAPDMSLDDAVAFFMLADSANPGGPDAPIERVRTNVFEKSKIVLPVISDADLASLEILSNPDMLRELRRRKQEAEEGMVVSWDSVKPMIVSGDLKKALFARAGKNASDE